MKLNERKILNSLIFLLITTVCKAFSLDLIPDQVQTFDANYKEYEIDLYIKEIGSTPEQEDFEKEVIIRKEGTTTPIAEFKVTSEYSKEKTLKQTFKVDFTGKLEVVGKFNKGKVWFLLSVHNTEGN